MQCAAQCDAIVTSDDWLRTFWYDAHWQDGIALARYDNGAGDHVVILFGANGQTVLKGFDHESPVSPHARDPYGVWPGIYDGLPPAWMTALEGDDIDHEDVTFCCWSMDGTTWQHGTAVIPDNMDDGAGWLLRMVQMDSRRYSDWARQYYEGGFVRLGDDTLRRVFDGAA